MDATLSDPLVGRVLDGRYRVLGRIGRGGMGVVYRALDTRLDREVALKVLRADLAHDLDARQRFVREAKSAARLAHPGIVSVLDQGSDEETAYLVMELVPGRTLRDVVREHGLLTPGEALAVASDVLDALSEAHRKGVLHRDVKPANVLVGDDGRVKVADFGLARSAAATAQSTAGNGAELLGTAEYLAPERVARGVADARSDVYGVGVLLFEMLTGQPPFTGDTPVRLAYRHVYDDPPAPSSLVAGLPAALDRAVLKALAKDPDERYADAAAFRAELRAARAALTPAELSARPARPAPGGAGDTVRIDLTGLERDGEAGPPAGAGALSALVAPASAGGTADEAPDAAVGSATGPRARTADVGWGPQGGRRRRSVVLMVATLVVLALAAGLSWFFLAGPGAWTTTPDVTGRDPDRAAEALAAAGLAVEREEAYSDTVPAGVVAATDPAAGDRVRRDGTVTLVVSLGVEQHPVPDVVGDPEADAARALTDGGLAVGEVRREHSEDVPEGDVVATDPAAGTVLDHDTPVALVVSLGRQPIDVPDVTGDTVAEARAALEDAGLVVGGTREETSESVPAGAVVSQDPDDGTLFRGDAVDLVVSTGPPLVEVPAVQGRQVADARAALEELGFRVRVENVLGGIFGTVRSSDPDAGRAVPRGSTITLTVV
ncbi:Stk1 family PASTA domain-containing Ser/Thr kinase [Kineococcus sp. SYSU DK004]|uniref:Stk1 family PASTA domain-containing Ser/Thr kinase n=1 Tax=Kineococcus sp. SYSU DK004 TaxID=3383125 RepID=UPI003D7CF4AE